MNIVYPDRDVRSMLGIEEGESWWLVHHNDNSDHGRCEAFFRSLDDTYRYIQRITEQWEKGEAGNELHPQPETLNLRLFRVKRCELADAYGIWLSQQAALKGAEDA